MKGNNSVILKYSSVKNKFYRTPYMMKLFHHSILILKEKRLLEMDEKRGDFNKIPSGGAEGAAIEHLTLLLNLIKVLKCGPVSGSQSCRIVC